MTKKRLDRVRARRPCFIPICCAAVLTTLAGCAGAPPSPAAAPEAEAAAEPADRQPAAPETEESPEVLEIRSLVPLPVRMAVALPDSEAMDKKPEAAPKVSEPLKAAPVPGPGAPATIAAPEPLKEAPAQPAPVKKTEPASPAPVKNTMPAPAAEKPAASPVLPASPSKTETEKADVKAGKKTEEVPSSLLMPPSPASTVLEAPRESAEPDRSAEAFKGSSVELPFKGSGWVYLGETEGREGIEYDSRRFDGSSAVFFFTAEREGEYLLRFQRQDPVSGEPESLIVRLVVRDPKSAPAEKDVSDSSDSGGNPAEDEASASDPASLAASGSRPAESGDAASPAPESVRPELPSSPEELLRMAREELAASRIATTLEALDKYISLFPFGSDEAFHIYAKAYEQNTPYRDIKKAYRYYKQIRDEWPRSPFWKDASERAAYIERHYFDIR